MKKLKKIDIGMVACIGDNRNIRWIALFVFSVMFMACRYLYEAVYFMVDLYRIIK